MTCLCKLVLLGQWRQRVNLCVRLWQDAQKTRSVSPGASLLSCAAVPRLSEHKLIHGIAAVISVLGGTVFDFAVTNEASARTPPRGSPSCETNVLQSVGSGDVPTLFANCVVLRQQDARPRRLDRFLLCRPDIISFALQLIGIRVH